MQKDKQTLNEMKQLMKMVISTFVNLYGMIPSAEDL